MCPTVVPTSRPTVEPTNPSDVPSHLPTIAPTGEHLYNTSHLRDCIPKNFEGSYCLEEDESQTDTYYSENHCYEEDEALLNAYYTETNHKPADVDTSTQNIEPIPGNNVEGSEKEPTLAATTPDAPLATTEELNLQEGKTDLAVRPDLQSSMGDNGTEANQPYEVAETYKRETKFGEPLVQRVKAGKAGCGSIMQAKTMQPKNLTSSLLGLLHHLSTGLIILLSVLIMRHSNTIPSRDSQSNQLVH